MSVGNASVFFKSPKPHLKLAYYQQGLFSITLVDEEVTLYTSAFNQSELLAAVQAHVAQYPTADPEQLFFNAIGNEVIRQYFHVSGQSVAVYDIWAIHIPKAASYSMAVVGKGVTPRSFQRWRSCGCSGSL